jgi:xanthine dehydrogenase large subunit
MVDARKAEPSAKEAADSPAEVEARHRPALHESGLRHTTGEAMYVDDLPEPPSLLVGHIVTSTKARARITRLEVEKARAVPGVRAVLAARDIPGHNDVGPVIHDEELLASSEVFFFGQSVALIVAETAEIARKAARLVEIEYEERAPIYSTQDAVRAGSFLSDPHVIARGDVESALTSAPLSFSGEVESGAQDHFYLETHVSLVLPEEASTYRVYSSSQHPSEVQATVADVLGIGRSAVVVEVPRMGGGFGGKETQAAQFAALAALGAWATKRPVKVWLNRDQDMATTGKRHPFWTSYRAGFDLEGRILALDTKTYANGGFSNDLSRSILDRALFHSDNSYYVPNIRLEGRVAKTNLPSNTAFRGFGGPQGMLIIETVLNGAAERLGLDPALVRARNFYGDPPRDRTPYDQQVTANRLPRLYEELIDSSDYLARRAAIERFNASSVETRRGIAFQTVKFGISFTASFLNQAGALVIVYRDGTVQMNHGGTEMGQGLHTKMLAVLSHALGVKKDKIRAMTTATDKVPNTSATAASSGADLNGQALKIAAETLKERLRPIAARLLRAVDGDAERIAFREGRVFIESDAARSIAFEEVVEAAYLAQIPLAATGYYRTPDIGYDRARGRGRPFHYFAYGAAVSEVEVSGLTGEHRLRRVDILHDVGDSLVPTIDLGQVEGGFIQGLGWLTSEEVIYDPQGRLVTHSPDTYKIPAIGDAPEEFRVRLLEHAPQADVIYGSKAVGEPPLMLAISGILALRHAIQSFGPERTEVRLALPATPEAILRAIVDAKSRVAPRQD